MIVTVASFKGGVGKTTTAVHLAAYLTEKAPTLLIDGDPNRSATGWAARGKLPCAVIDERQAIRQAPKYTHHVIDTQARPSDSDLRELIEGCDLLVVPTTPDALSLEALISTVRALQRVGASSDRYRILLTLLPPGNEPDGAEARASLDESGLPLFTAEVRRRKAFVKAALNGCLVHQTKDPRGGDGWDEYRALGREIEGLMR